MLAQRRRWAMLGPAEAARRLGISIKTLKVYERFGLVSPNRTRHGWRVYSPNDFDRLSQVLSFKAMGFGLSQIATLLDAQPDDLIAALVAQEEDLQARRVGLDRAISAVRHARRRLGAPSMQLAA
jgi:DNA-binding transcriptional MerR regulator